MISITKFMFEIDSMGLDEAISSLIDVSVSSVSNSQELTERILASSAGLILFGIHEKKDLVEAAICLKGLRHSTKDIPIKAVVINFTGDPKFEKAAMKLGVQDVISPDLAQKVLRFKFNFWLRTLRVLILKSKKSVMDQNVFLLAGVKWQEQLNLESDIWLLKSPSDCSQENNLWTVRLMGPSPLIAVWEQTEENQWRLKINEAEKSLFIQGEGEWIYEGEKKPEFSWEDKVWVFKGERIDLKFKTSNEEFSRLSSSKGELNLPLNSLFAESLSSVLLESSQRDLVSDWGNPKVKSEELLQELTLSIRIKNELNEVSARFEDLFDELLQLKTTDPKINNGKIQILIQSQMGKVKEEYFLEGEITFFEEFGNENILDIKLTSSDNDILSELKSQMEVRQKNILEFLKRAKGIQDE